MNKNKSNVATSPKKQTFSWKTFIAAFIVAFFLNIFLSAYSGVEPRKNIIWTIAWIYLSIEAWKFWKWKALLPYPLFIVLSIIASFVVMAAEHEYFSMLNLSVKLFFNFGGLLTFFLLLRKSQHNQDIVADAFPPVEYATEDQVATNSSKTLPRENHSTISLQKVVDEERVYDEIAKELETGVADKGLWTRLFAECDGDESRSRCSILSAERSTLLQLNMLIWSSRKMSISSIDRKTTNLVLKEQACITINGLLTKVKHRQHQHTTNFQKN